MIARTASFRYRGSSADLSQVAEELGVRFVLEGSVRRAGNRVRVTAQLIEASGLHHVWADRFDADLVDIFAVQDEITRAIVVAIDPAIRLAEAERSSRTRPESLDAWHHTQRGWSELYKYKKVSNAEARRHFAAAARRDAGYAEAHAGLSQTHFLDAWLLWADDPAASARLAYEEAKRAIELDDRDALSHVSMATASYAMGRMESTVRAAERAVELNPSLALAHVMGGVGRIHGGDDPERGINMITSAIALNPNDPSASWFWGGRALGHFVLGNHDAAIADARAAINLRYGYLMGRVVLTASLAELGEVEAAARELETILEIRPDFAPSFLDLYTFNDEADRERIVAGLRSAGLEA